MPSTSAPATVATSSGSEKTQVGALVALTSLFFMWGFITVLNDILSPHLQSIFELNYKQASLVQFAFFFAYFIFSIPAAKLIAKLGYKMTLVIGLVTMGIGALLFIPAANAASYGLFLGALMILAGGITALQVAANPYVAVLGPSQTASSRLNLTQAFNSLGTTVGPSVGAFFILTAATLTTAQLHQLPPAAIQAYKVQQSSSVKIPYMVIAVLLFALAAFFYLLRLPTIPEVEKTSKSSESVWKYRHLILGVVGIFVYVGAEVSIGTFLIKYFHMPDIGNLPEIQAASLVTCYWAGAMIGRFIGSAILSGIKRAYIGVLLLIGCVILLASYLSSGHEVAGSAEFSSRAIAVIAHILVLFRPIVVLCVIVFGLLLLASFVSGGQVALKTGHLLGLCALSAGLLALVSMLTSGNVAMWSIILVGFFNSIMFPSIFTLGIAKLGPLTGDGSGLLIMAIVGGAIIPFAFGALADMPSVGLHHAFILPLLCYLYIAFYGFKGSQPKPA